MKIALCLFGHIGGKKEKNGTLVGEVDLSRVFESYKKMIINDHDVDIFIHSWSMAYHDEIMKLYKPTASIIEEQKDFSFVKLEDYSMKHFDTYTNYYITYQDKTTDVLIDTMIRSSSRWYSNSKVLQIMSDYSRNSNVIYDYVFQGRLDLLFFKKINFLELDSRYFYSPVREKEKGKALNEYFLISNQKNAEIFSDIYNNKNNYSIRPPIAAKQHLDKNNIETRECNFELAKDFNTLRNQEGKELNQRLSKRLTRVIKNPTIIIIKIYEQLGKLLNKPNV